MGYVLQCTEFDFITSILNCSSTCRFSRAFCTLPGLREEFLRLLKYGEKVVGFQVWLENFCIHIPQLKI